MLFIALFQCESHSTIEENEIFNSDSEKQLICLLKNYDLITMFYAWKYIVLSMKQQFNLFYLTNFINWCAKKKIRAL